MPGIPLVILVNSDDPFNAKTALGVLRYSPDPIVGLVDPARAGKTAQDVYGVRPDVPIFGKVADLPGTAKRLLVGIASRGGDLQTRCAWRSRLPSRGGWTSTTACTLSSPMTRS